MNWADRLLSEEDLASFVAESDEPALAGQVAGLIRHQQQNWPLLSDGYAAFANLATKRLRPDAGGAEIIIQHNPRRIRSTAAQVDRVSVTARGCFLCADGLPAEEKGIAYGSEFIILCNPYPILDRHLSIVHRLHVEQKLSGHVETLLSLARDLGRDFFVLYNGPECGASAPDHLHFQASSRALLPIQEALRMVDDPQGERCDLCDRGRQSFELFTLTDNQRTAIVFRGNNAEEIAYWVEAAMNELTPGVNSTEPLVNIVCFNENNDWTLFLFPRAKHRPSCFYTQEIIVSPGAIDMAGVVVVPRAEDFSRLGSAEMTQVYSEVSLSEDVVADALERLGLSEGAEELT